MGTANAIVAVLTILGVAAFFVWLLIWEYREKRALRESADRWEKAMQEIRRQAEERHRKKEEKDGTE